MKLYDYQKLKAVCEERQPVSASLGMSEDWGWTAEEVWKDGKLLIPTDNPLYEVAGIPGSHWATPTLSLIMPNGDDVRIPCFVELPG